MSSFVEDEWLIAQDATDTLLAAGYDIVGPCGSVGAALAAIAGYRVDYVSGHEDQDDPGSLRGHRVLVKPAEPRALLAAAESMTRQRAQGSAAPAQMNGA